MVFCIQSLSIWFQQRKSFSLAVEMAEKKRWFPTSLLKRIFGLDGQILVKSYQYHCEIVRFWEVDMLWVSLTSTLWYWFVLFFFFFPLDRRLWIFCHAILLQIRGQEPWLTEELIRTRALKFWNILPCSKFCRQRSFTTTLPHGADSSWSWSRPPLFFFPLQQKCWTTHKIPWIQKRKKRRKLGGIKFSCFN